MTVHPSSNRLRYRRMTPARRRTGFSQVEVAMSALIAGILLSSALDMAGHATRSNLANKDLLQARLIASGLIAEILELPFAEPNGSAAFGPEAGETTSPATRNLFDDVDDYHGWSSAAVTKSGAAIPESTGLTTTVQIAMADPDQLAEGVSGTPVASLKRITVKVLRGGQTVSTLTAVVAQ